MRFKKSSKRRFDMIAYMMFLSIQNGAVSNPPY